jgi:CheY-like chemotaxis protein
MNPNRHILIVDDDRNNIELLLAALTDQKFPHETVVTYDGGEALDYLFGRGKFPDRTCASPMLVLLDLKMPGVDGFEVLRQVKSDNALKRIPVVVFSSSDGEPEVGRSYDLGANAFVTKPVDSGRFLEVVKSIGNFWATVNEPPPVVPGAPRLVPFQESAAA